MASWTNIPNEAVGVGGIPSGTTVTALRDNPVAIAEGAAGAPRVQLPAIVDALASLQVGGLGSYALLVYPSFGDTSPGQIRAGSSLRYGNTNAEEFSGPSPSGTWRCMGWTRASGQTPRGTVWLRVT
jgi:hypothetical protein